MVVVRPLQTVGLLTLPMLTVGLGSTVMPRVLDPLDTQLLEPFPISVYVEEAEGTKTKGDVV